MNAIFANAEILAAHEKKKASARERQQPVRMKTTEKILILRHGQLAKICVTNGHLGN